jgi:hypothetical protein
MNLLSYSVFQGKPIQLSVMKHSRLLSTFISYEENIVLLNPKAVFLVMCDPSMKEL